MSKYLKILLGINALLIVVIGTLFYIRENLLKKEKVDQREKITKQGQATSGGKDYQLIARLRTVKETVLEVSLDNGSVFSFSLPGDLFFFCRERNEELYGQVKANPTALDPSIFIKVDEIAKSIGSDEKIELFLYSLSDGEVLVKGIVSLECS